MLEFRKFMCDFETTVYEGQSNTEVWASALVELYTENVIIHHSIEETYNFFVDLEEDVLLYYHNLKFDGEFWLYYLTCVLKMKQAYEVLNETGTDVKFKKIPEMPKNTYRYTISDMGQWYEIVIKTPKDKYIVIRDSLKLLPFSVKKIGNDFKTKHQKLEMVYQGYRYAGCDITPEEREYIANDVLVVKEALEIMFGEGHDKMTIGACCLGEFKKNIEPDLYKMMFPDLSKYQLDAEKFGSTNADEYIRKAYGGGWCYVAKGKEGKIKKNGITADVNSLYPSMMHSMSGNRYPLGMPRFFRGDIPDFSNFIYPSYYFVRFTCRFYLKKDKLPFVHIRGTSRYRSTENLETSDIRDKNTGEYKRFYKYDFDDTIYDSNVEMTMTCTDFELFKAHYDIQDLKILDGCWFCTDIGIFDDYINKYKKMKMESTGAQRQLAKLFLNNLYGKFASSSVSNFRVAIDYGGDLRFFTVQANDKKIGYIPVGAAITSYARNFTIRAAQSNYYGPDKKGFCYADTDSIHCDLPIEDIKGIMIDDAEFCHWKIESYWDEAVFTRQKTYIEHITHKDGKKLDEPRYDVKCAGMPEKCKNLFLRSFDEIDEEELKYYTKDEQEFLKVKRNITDFKVGLCVPGKLLPKHIEGGLILTDTTYEMR